MWMETLIVQQTLSRAKSLFTFKTNTFLGDWTLFNRLLKDQIVPYLPSMAVLASSGRPTEGIRHEQPDTTLYVQSNNVGKGTLFVTESVLKWISETTHNLSIDYRHIILHAVASDPNAFGEECIYMQTDAELPFPVNDDEGSDDDFDPVVRSVELRFVPEDKQALSAIYNALTICQGLNPDPPEGPESDEDEGYYYNFAEEDDVEGAQRDLDGMHLSTNGIEGSYDGGSDADMDEEQFADAEP